MKQNKIFFIFSFIFVIYTMCKSFGINEFLFKICTSEMLCTLLKLIFEILLKSIYCFYKKQILLRMDLLNVLHACIFCVKCEFEHTPFPFTLFFENTRRRK